MKYNTLIIDDEWEERKKSYEILFGETMISHEFLENFEEARNLIGSSKFDFIVLDLFLQKFSKSSGNYENSTLLDIILGFIGASKKPVILISRMFNQKASWISIVKSKVDVIYYLGWNELFHQEQLKDEEILESTQMRIFHSVADYYGRTIEVKGEDEKITLLVLSDLQFGDSSFSVDNIIGDKILSKYLADHDIVPDLISITGDVAYSGLPSEFNEAYKWIMRLCDDVLPKQDFFKRILLIPGNHDVNLYLSTGDQYIYKFPTQAGKYSLEKRTKELNEHKKYGLTPFCEFAFKLTQDPIWSNRPNDLCWVNDNFSLWGIRFIHLNSVANLDYNNPCKVNINDETIEELVNDQKLRSHHKELYTIALTHHGPYDFGYNHGEDSDPRFSRLMSLVNALEINSLIYGHRHSPTRKYPIEYQGKYSNKLECVQIGTMSLKAISRQEDSQRSFSVIELDRKNNKVINLKVRIFEINKQNIREKSPY